MLLKTKTKKGSEEEIKGTIRKGRGVHAYHSRLLFSSIPFDYSALSRNMIIDQQYGIVQQKKLMIRQSTICCG